MRRLSIIQWFSNVSIKSKLYFVTGIMLALIIVELFMLWLMVTFLSSTRAYVGGEGLWSKAQKDATFYILQYVYTHQEKDYQSFLEFIKIPLGDRKARIELLKAKPNYEAAFQGFLEGGNQPEDIPGMMSLFQKFHRVPHLAKAIEIWGQGDDMLSKLITVGKNAREKILSKSMTIEERDAIINDIYQYNKELTSLANNFSYALGDASRWLENLVLKILLTIAITVEVSGLLMTILVTFSIRRGIDEIVKTSNSVRKLDFSKRAISYSDDEIGLLAKAFNQMIDDLEDSLKRLEKELKERQRAENELKILHQKMLNAARQTGMAEVSNNILHSVGNVLNSINVTVGVLNEKISKSKLILLKDIANLLKEHQHDFANFISSDPKGSHLTSYLQQIAEYWDSERGEIKDEIDQLNKHIERIKDIINMQHALGDTTRLQESVRLPDLIDDAILMSISKAELHNIVIKRDYEYMGEVLTDKGKLMQIMINILNNAKESLLTSQQPVRVLTVCAALKNELVHIEVSDNGVGIPRENITKIFSLGFTTKPDSHGFGLHMSALLAKDLHGSLVARSHGPTLGATFILEIPKNGI